MCGADDAAITIAGEAVPVGHTVIVRIGVREADLGVFLVTDTVGNSYRTDATSLNDSAEGVRIDVVRAYIAASLEPGESILLDLPEARATMYAADEFEGMHDAAFVERVPAIGDDETPRVDISTLAAPTLLIGAVAIMADTTFGVPFEWMPLTSVDAACGGATGVGLVHGGYRVVDAAGDYTYSGTLGFGTRWTAVVVSYGE
jgi:hypothetical protein